jgi:hypothetical protein
MHGDEAQSSTFTSQLKPLKPAPQTQLYANVWSKHVPLFRHGTDEHSSSSDQQEPIGTSE